ncbi:type II secretion system protein GspJ [Antarctobacter jejuensis]|uniref:type II secretion system protein GspJ n=1 Tax=Antarctobacter jejuensis TaxID=1439938 RepID=UPI003FD037AA
MTTRGLSLIELVVAMALFALVAVMGTQTLTGTIRTRDALTERDSRDRDLALTLALLRSDLDRLAPMLFHAPGGPPQSALHHDPTQGRVHLSVTALPGDPSAEPFQRAEWRLDRATGRLMRRSWPATSPARADQRSAERRLMTGVEALRLRSFWPGFGWVEGTGIDLRPPGSAPGATDGDTAFALLANQYSDLLPLAIEITLTVEDLGDIRIMEAMQ